MAPIQTIFLLRFSHKAQQKESSKLCRNRPYFDKEWAACWRQGVESFEFDGTTKGEGARGVRIDGGAVPRQLPASPLPLLSA